MTTRHFLLLGGISAILVSIAFALFGDSSYPGCKNQVVQRVISPDALLQAVVFERDCGATTGFSTHVSLLAAAASLPSDAGNLLIADDDHGRVAHVPAGGLAIGVRWLDDRHLLLSCEAGVRLIKAVPQVGGIEVNYRVGNQVR